MFLSEKGRKKGWNCPLPEINQGQQINRSFIQKWWNVSQVVIRNSVWGSIMAISYISINVFLSMCILTLQLFTCAFTVAESMSVKGNLEDDPLHSHYLVVWHEESTDSTIWLHSAHGCIILLFSHKVWGLRLPKVDQRLCPRFCFFYFLLNWWNLRQFLRDRAWKHSEYDTQGKTTLVIKEANIPKCLWY